MKCLLTYPVGHDLHINQSTGAVIVKLQHDSTANVVGPFTYPTPLKFIIIFLVTVPSGPISVAGAVAMTFFFTLIPTIIITGLTVFLVMWCLCVKHDRSANSRHKNGHNHAPEPDEKDVCHVNVAYDSKSANITDSINRRPAPTTTPKYQPKKPPPPYRPTAPSRPY